MFEGINWRKEKKIDRIVVDETYSAYLLGQENAERKTPKRNPYPAGKRHNAFEYGMSQADPMGDHHGRNY